MSVKVTREKEWQVIVILTGPKTSDEILKFYNRCFPENADVSSVTVRPNVKKRKAKK